MKTVQYFSDEYLDQCKQMSLEERLEYLENFRLLMEKNQSSSKTKSKSKLISIKMPVTLLAALKQKAKREGLPYQTYLKKILIQSL